MNRWIKTSENGNRKIIFELTTGDHAVENETKYEEKNDGGGIK
ncbi:hypothetical protein [Alteribacillus sp. YIM 98480]|nr:hypothetical protein [Alteribacillus sp. YIM 98480]